MPEFIPVVVAALLILASLYVVFGGGFAVKTVKPPGYTIEETQPSQQQSVGWVGYTPEQVLRHVILGRDFTVSYAVGGEQVARINGTISRGLLSGTDKKVSFSLQPKDIALAKVSFHVDNSNYYGQLIMALNGKEIFRDKAPAGDHEFSFNTSLLKESNFFEVDASSSGWRFWAPTVYIVDAKVLASYFGTRTQSYKFDLSQDEFKGLDTARLSLSFKDIQGNGNISVKVNGEEVFMGRGSIGKTLTKDFDTRLVRASNTVEFQADKDTKYSLDEAEVIVFYRPATYVSKTMWYNITDSQYDSLSRNNVTLRFYLESLVGTPVGLLVKVTDGKGSVHNIIVQELREKQYYSTVLTNNELKSGSNKIDFVSSGQGGFLITNNTIS